MNDFIFRILSTLQALLIASIIGVVLIGVSAVFAHAAGEATWSWNSDGTGQYDSYQPPSSRRWSPQDTTQNRYTDQDRQAYNAWQNHEAARQNEDLIKGYHRSNSTQAAPSSSTPFWIFTPEGNRLCVPSYGGNIRCN